MIFILLVFLEKVMDKQAIFTGMSKESLYRFAKRRYAVSASRFGKWAVGLEAVPKDNGRSAVRKPGDDHDAENLTQFQRQAIDRGNREHAWFDESCRFWSGDEGILLTRSVREQTEAAFAEAEKRCESIARAKPAALRRFNALRRLHAYGTFIALFCLLLLARLIV